MKTVEEKIAHYYGQDDLLQRIEDGLAKAGVNLNDVQAADLALVDEFHIGGRTATAYAVDKLALTADMHVLDVGCGIGGAARYIASQTGATVTGIDLTPEYIEVAEALSKRLGLGDAVAFQHGNALNMPFKDDAFDAAVSFHAAMNIRDRQGLYGEIARVMKPGARLCVYDVLKKDDAELPFPMPWAETEETSHLVTRDDMRVLLADAGFEVREVEDRTDFGVQFFKQMVARAVDGPPPLGVHLMMGNSAPQRIKNAREMLQNGRLVPTQVIADFTG